MGVKWKKKPMRDIHEPLESVRRIQVHEFSLPTTLTHT